MKVKVIEVEAIKLDPNAVHLVVFGANELTRDQMQLVAKQLDTKGVNAVFTQARDVHNAVKVYELSKDMKETV